MNFRIEHYFSEQVNVLTLRRWIFLALNQREVEIHIHLMYKGGSKIIGTNCHNKVPVAEFALVIFY